jgi:hypothetical protein
MQPNTQELQPLLPALANLFSKPWQHKPQPLKPLDEVLGSHRTDSATSSADTEINDPFEDLGYRGRIKRH